MVHHVYIKPGGVPDKLCVFPADELKTASHWSRHRWPHHDSVFHAHTYIYMYVLFSQKMWRPLLENDPAYLSVVASEGSGGEGCER